MKNKVAYYLKKLRTPLFALSMTLSLIGSYQLYHNQYSSIFKEVTVIIISIMKLFTFFPTNGLLDEAPLAYEIAIWMAPLSTMVGVFSIFEDLYKSIKLSLSNLWGNFIVVMGANEEAITYIKNIKKESPSMRVFCLLQEKDQVKEKSLEDLNVQTIFLDYTNPEDEINILKIKDLHLTKAAYIISFEEEVESFGKISALDQMLSRNDNVIKLYLLSQNYRLKELVEYKMDQLKSFDIHYFNLEELLVKNLLENSDFKFNLPEKMKESFKDFSPNSMEDIAKKMGTYKLAIIGFSSIAEQFLNQTANLLTINPLENMSVLIIDDNIYEKFNKYKTNKTLIDKVIDINLIEKKENTDLTSILEGHKFQAAIFASNDPLENIINADKYIDILSDVPIAVYAKNQKILNTVIESLKIRHSHITSFGDIKKVLTSQMIIKEELFQKAKKFNTFYNKIAQDIFDWDFPLESEEEAWRKLSNIKKESSLYQSAHQASKFTILDKFTQFQELDDTPKDILLSWEQRIKDMSIAEVVYEIEKDPYMNFMTALEHKRWNNFYYMRDFKYDIEKNEIKKTHDCLIDDWDTFLKSKQRDKAMYDFISTLSLL